jgi:hypothetical protein
LLPDPADGDDGTGQAGDELDMMVRCRNFLHKKFTGTGIMVSNHLGTWHFGPVKAPPIPDKHGMKGESGLGCAGPEIYFDKT